MRKYAVIVAGGSGSRMQSSLPKQFLELAGKPILMHTIEAFSFDDIRIIVVLPEKQVSEWHQLCRKYDFKIPHEIVNGGEARFHSVRQGLHAIKEPGGLVAIHDGVRPLVSRDIIVHSYQEAENRGNAIASMPLKDSIRTTEKHGNKMADRSAFRLIQTPQTFQLDLIKKAFDTDYMPSFTDDASVLEHSGIKIHMIDGDYLNIKITTPEDLLVAESFLRG